MKKLVQILSLIMVGVLSFLVFLYFSFPYRVLKEAISVKATEATGIIITIGDLEPAFPLGLKAKNVTLASPGSTSATIKTMRVGVGLFAFLIGRLSLSIDLTDKAGGSLDIVTRFSIIDLVGGTNFLPTVLTVDGEKYQLDELLNFYLTKTSKDPNASFFVKDFVSKLTIKGALDAKIDFSFNASDINQSVGDVSIKMMNSSVAFHQSLQLPEQKFETAMLKANFKNGVLVVSDASKFQASDITLALNGNVKLKPRIEKSVLDVNIELELRSAFKQQLEPLMEAMMNHKPESKIKIKISGAVTPQPQVDIQ